MQMPEMAIFVFMAALIAGPPAAVKSPVRAGTGGVAEKPHSRGDRPR
jgi:hypothetical protein